MCWKLLSASVEQSCADGCRDACFDSWVLLPAAVSGTFLVHGCAVQSCLWDLGMNWMRIKEA